MFIDLTPAQASLQKELRSYFAAMMTPEVRRDLGEGVADNPRLYRRLVKQMGRDGWLGVGWPTEYGGRGMSAVEQYIFFEEANRAEAPVPLVTLNTVGPTLIAYGTEEQKSRFLPGILAGDVHFAIGYTEAEAGTDLAALRTRAQRVADGYVINGSKVFTTGGHDADFVWLAVRTNPDAPKHRGISILIVDTTAPGFSWTPMPLVRGRVNATYYEDVHVPFSALVGEEDAGWRLITTQLNHERVALAGSSGKAFAQFDATVAWARQERLADGGRVIDQPWVQTILARLHARLEALRLLNLRAVSQVERGGMTGDMAAAVKVYGTELAVEVASSLLQIVGEGGLLRFGSPDAIADGVIEHAYRGASINTFGGGANDVMRGIVATMGLGLPRPGS